MEMVAATLRDSYNSLVEASYLSVHTILNASIGGSDSLKSDFLGALTRFGWWRRFNSGFRLGFENCAQQ